MRLGSSSVAFSSQNLPKLAATSVENVVKALQSHRWTATVRIFEILFSQWVNREKRQKKRKEFGKLTLLLALAELLAEILGHHARARAVAGMVRVVTRLVVVHLIGRVIWSSRGRRLRRWEESEAAVPFCSFLGEIYLSWVGSLPITWKKATTALVLKATNNQLVYISLYQKPPHPCSYTKKQDFIEKISV